MSSHTLVLIGQMGSGKDTLAARLIAEHGYTRVAFADPLKAAALAVDPVIGLYHLAEMVRSYGWDRAKRHPEVRRFLQRLGVAMRAIDPDIWVRPLAASVAATDGPVVVTDCRFPNEYDWARAVGASTVRIRRPHQDAGSSEMHESEMMAADVEGFPTRWTVTNSGTVGDLHAFADTLAARIAPTLARTA